MKKTFAFASLAALSLGLAGCHKNASDADATNVDNVAAPADSVTGDNMATDNLATDNGSATSDAAATPMTAADFANAAAASDNFEIQSSKLASDKAKSADIKAFAQMLVKDHTKSTADLKAAAAKANPPITPSPTLTAEQEANLTALKNASAADFDQLYIGQQIPAHQKALTMLQGYAATGDVTGFKDFAAKVSPVVQAHLDKANSLKK
jgi:putative membrane protein